MKKEAATMDQIRFKQEEIKKLLNDNLMKIRTSLNPNLSNSQMLAKVDQIIRIMNISINQKVLELISLIPQPINPTGKPAENTTTPPPPQTADDAKDNHLGPRGRKQNKKLPDFWRKNFDYGTGPYSHMDELKTITDKRLSKRK
jgi:hypothetical protein